MTLTSETRAPVGARERPIIFSGPMVRAILAGRKTQTRRVLSAELQAAFDRAGESILRRHPHQQGIGWDEVRRLWVKEALGRRPASFLGIEATNGVESAFYLADEAEVLDEHEFNLCPWWRGQMLSPIYMPRRASRLTLEVTEVRVERLQDISGDDVVAEGAWPADQRQIGRAHEAVAAYRDLWNSIHGKDAWDANPWVAAITFRLLPANESQKEGAAV